MKLSTKKLTPLFTLLALTHNNNHSVTASSTSHSSISGTASIINTTAMDTTTTTTIRNEILALIEKNPEGHLDEKVREEVSSKLIDYSKSRNGDQSDVLFAIGKSVFGVRIPPPVVAAPAPAKSAGTSDEEEVKKDVVIDFEYMKQFMKDVFVTYGCSEEQAEVCSEVLIEADKRGIDSHGLGRLKPIYCDRIDKGILWANKPISVIRETETTALIDGNLGLGLYVGPHCMKLAIEKAKKYGVGFVVCQNSTHYGIAGYYASMATDAGCVGFTGTNARPSIAPTFGTLRLTISLYRIMYIFCAFSVVKMDGLLAQFLLLLL